jgi:hypothetical protein
VLLAVLKVSKKGEISITAESIAEDYDFFLCCLVNLPRGEPVMEAFVDDDKPVVETATDPTAAKLDTAGEGVNND